MIKAKALDDDNFKTLRFRYLRYDGFIIFLFFLFAFSNLYVGQMAETNTINTAMGMMLIVLAIVNGNKFRKNKNYLEKLQPKDMIITNSYPLSAEIYNDGVKTLITVEQYTTKYYTFYISSNYVAQTKNEE